VGKFSDEYSSGWGIGYPCEAKGMATGFDLHKQLESYEDLVASNFLVQIDAVSECLTKRSKITLLQ